MLAGFGGWNFVDYRDAHLEGGGWVDASTDWNVKVPRGTRIDFAQDPKLRGTWEMKGLAEYWQAQRDQQIQEYKAKNP
jgi:hypothetical protein